MPLNERTIEPHGRLPVLCDATHRAWKKSQGGLKEQMKPGLSFRERPHFQLVREPPEARSGHEIGELGNGRRHSARDFIAADARKHDAITALPETGCSLASRLGISWSGSRNCVEGCCRSVKQRSAILRKVDMETRAASLFLYCADVGALIPIGLEIVEVGKSIEPRHFGVRLGEYGVSDTHDGGGIHSAAEFCEHGPGGTEAALDRFPEHGSEVVFVIGIGAITDSLVGIKIPIFVSRLFPRLQTHVTSGRYT